MMQDLEHNIYTDEEGWVVMELSGAITESSDFSSLTERAEGRVRVDLSGVQRINSSGVREWIRFVTTISADREVILERCTPPIVQQLNVISNMAADARVRSVMLPYYCEGCDSDVQVPLELVGEEPQIPETRPCTSCNDEMEFDDIPEDYLSFVMRK